MCGIAGLVSLTGARADEDILAAMSARIRHRGPDGSGIHADGPVGLAHRRLAIIDLTDTASQPMTNEDGTLWLVFNGEIYNFIELREELLGRGHTFRFKRRYRGDPPCLRGMGQGVPPAVHRDVGLRPLGLEETGALLRTGPVRDQAVLLCPYGGYDPLRFGDQGPARPPGCWEGPR